MRSYYARHSAYLCLICSDNFSVLFLTYFFPSTGPCLDMNCLHGVLMHGDSEQGDGHTSEHKYERLQREVWIMLYSEYTY